MDEGHAPPVNFACRRHARWAALAALALSACGRGGAEEAAAVRDSAGVRVVEVRAGAVPAWRAPAAPEVAIGAADGEPAYELSEVAAALRLSDGRIVVALDGSRELRFFSPSGEYLSRAGREGGGPGEFLSIGWAARLAGDSVGVWDARAGRWSRFAGDGAAGRAEAVPAVGAGLPRVRAVFGDGALVVGTGYGTVFRPGVEVRRDPVHLFRVAAGRAPRPLGTFAGDETVGVAGPNGAARIGRPFGAATHVAAAGRALYVGDSGRGEVEVHADDGRLRARLRLTGPRKPVSGADVSAYRERALASLASPVLRRLQEQALREAKAPEHAPAFDALAAGGDGRLWLRMHAAPDAESADWLVFGADLRPLGRVALPARLTVTDAGDGYVLGVEEDDLGVERVRLYRVDE